MTCSRAGSPNGSRPLSWRSLPFRLPHRDGHFCGLERQHAIRRIRQPRRGVIGRDAQGQGQACALRHTEAERTQVRPFLRVGGAIYKRSSQSVTFVLTRNRVIGVTAPAEFLIQHLRVRFAELPPPWDVWQGTELWAREPQPVCDLPGIADATSPECGEIYWVAALTCDRQAAYAVDWARTTRFIWCIPASFPASSRRVTRRQCFPRCTRWT